jgi:hypothetical protein
MIYFLKAFENTRYWLPFEIWMMINEIIEEDLKRFYSKCARIENLLNFDFEEVLYFDCIERIFTVPNNLSSVIAVFPRDDFENHMLLVQHDNIDASVPQLMRLLQRFTSYIGNYSSLVSGYSTDDSYQEEDIIDE